MRAGCSVPAFCFLPGHIEDIPLPVERVDVVISSCVINLSTARPRDLLQAAGFTGIAITLTDDAAPGLRAVIIQATEPGAPAPRQEPSGRAKT